MPTSTPANRRVLPFPVPPDQMCELENRVLGTALGLHNAKNLPERIARRMAFDRAVAAYSKAIDANRAFAVREAGAQ